MIIFFSYLLVFMIGALAGWIMELFYRRLKHKTWVNPGFLTGPTLPIYGIGLVCLHFISSFSFGIDNFALRLTIQTIVIGIVFTLIEYIAGIIFIEHMHVKLWDYSNEKFNYKGIICLKFSIAWMALGLLFNIFIDPFIQNIAEAFIKNVDIAGFFLGLYYGILIVDFGMSLNIVDKMKKFAEEHQIVISYESIKYHIKSKYDELKEKRASFLYPFKTNKMSFREILESYLEKHKELKERSERNEDNQ